MIKGDDNFTSGSELSCELSIGLALTTQGWIEQDQWVGVCLLLIETQRRIRKTEYTLQLGMRVDRAMLLISLGNPEDVLFDEYGEIVFKYCCKSALVLGQTLRVASQDQVSNFWLNVMRDVSIATELATA